jgi:hypothetical protein
LLQIKPPEIRRKMTLPLALFVPRIAAFSDEFDYQRETLGSGGAADSPHPDRATGTVSC